jgi:hypothetical protein
MGTRRDSAKRSRGSTLKTRATGRRADGLKHMTFSPGLRAMVDSDPRLVGFTRQLADRITFTMTSTTVGGQPIQGFRGQFRNVKLALLRPHEAVRDQAISRLERLGFEILHRGRFGTTVAGGARLIGDVLGEPLMVSRQARRPTSRAAACFAAETAAPEPHELFVAPSSSLSFRVPGLGSGIDHFVFTPPALSYATLAARPPQTDYFSLTGPQLARLLKSAAAAGAGQGVRVAMIDTGFDLTHPYYRARHWAFSAHASPGGPDATVDPEGHGTAMASNVFALAPAAQVCGIRQANPPYADAVELGFETLGADILSCSWGWDREQSFPTLEATLQSFVEEGKVILFAAGNGQYAWPASMPAVIAVGGAYVDATGQLQASDYASGFVSSLYPGRQVPDVCGLCGMQPLAVYIPMPCPPGSVMDRKFAGRTFPDGDETGARDGWVVASGTSAATPQVAGALAQLLQAVRARGNELTNAMAKDLLQESATLVSCGRNACGIPASPQRPNGAAGFGLTNVAALMGVAHKRGLI